MGIVNVVCSNIITNDKNDILFVKESKEISKDRYSLPAGRLEFGETLIECAIREAKEETGLNVILEKLVGIYQRPASSEKSNTTVFCFYSKIISGEITPTEEHPVVEFLSLEQISKLQEDHKLRSRYMYPAINDYINGQEIDIHLLKVL